MSDNIELTDLNDARSADALNTDGSATTTTTRIDTDTNIDPDRCSKGVIPTISQSISTFINLIASSFFELFLPMTYLKVPSGAPARDHVSYFK